MTLFKALGADSGISKSEVSRICADLDTDVAAFRDRPLADQRFPYVFLDATYCNARVDHRVVSQAVVIATGVAADGRREVLGFEVGDSEDGAFWTAFLRSLKTRGLPGVQLVISDAQAGLRAAIKAISIGAAWQRCRVHFLRNVVVQVPKGSAEMVAAAIRTGHGRRVRGIPPGSWWAHRPAYTVAARPNPKRRLLSGDLTRPAHISRLLPIPAATRQRGSRRYPTSGLQAPSRCLSHLPTPLAPSIPNSSAATG
jgi:hypothetical protein